MALEAGTPLRLELFNVFERGARLLWSEYGPVPGVAGGGGAGSAPDQDGQEPCAAHVLVIGLGRLGESLIVTAGPGARRTGAEQIPQRLACLRHAPRSAGCASRWSTWRRTGDARR